MEFFMGNQCLEYSAFIWYFYHELKIVIWVRLKLVMDLFDLGRNFELHMHDYVCFRASHVSKKTVKATYFNGARIKSSCFGFILFIFSQPVYILRTHCSFHQVLEPNQKCTMLIGLHDPNRGFWHLVPYSLSIASHLDHTAICFLKYSQFNKPYRFSTVCWWNPQWNDESGFNMRLWLRWCLLQIK